MGCQNAKSEVKPNTVVPLQNNLRKIEDNQSSFWDSQSQNFGVGEQQQQTENTICSIENIYYYYSFLKRLGNGAFGSVMLAESKRQEGQQVAIKVIDKRSVKGPPSFYLKREVDIIRQLDHPNICKFLETYMDKDKIYLVMEYCSGGTLKDKFVNKESLTELQVAQVMKKLFYATNYLHTRNIVHRDLKLENVVYTSKDPNSDIKIIDFGLSKKLNVRASRKKHTKVGSAFYMGKNIFLRGGYKQKVKSIDIKSKEIKFSKEGRGSLRSQMEFNMLFKRLLQLLLLKIERVIAFYLFILFHYQKAPEVLLHEKYERECDVWSLGVMMYFLLCRELPFEDFAEIESGQFTFEAPVWKYVSDDAKDLIKNILLVNTKKRIKLNEALEHKWFKIIENEELSQQQNENKLLPLPHRSYCKLVELLLQFKMDSLLKREVLLIMVKSINNNENITPKNLFRNIDKDQNGIITADELKLALYELGFHDIANNNSIDQLLLKISGINKQENISLQRGVSETNYLNYSEFIAATLDQDIYLTKFKLFNTFKYLNPSETGFITLEDISDVIIKVSSNVYYVYQILAREGRKVSEAKLKQINEDLSYYQSQPGKLYFEDFCKLMGYENPKASEELVISNKETPRDPLTQQTTTAAVSYSNKQEVPQIALIQASQQKQIE